MKILVTGGSGFIGRHLLWELEKQYPEAQIINYDIRKPEVESSATHVEGNICNKELLSQTLAGVSTVVHLAAAHSDFGISKEEYYKINETGTRNLLEACSQNGICNVTNYSSVAVYGSGTQGANEESSTLPEHNYGSSKLAAEKVVHEWVQGNSSNKAVIIRPAVVIGPWHRANMFRLIEQIDRGRYFCNIDKGEHIKSMAAVQNLVRFTAATLAEDFSSEQLEVFNYVDYPQLCVRKTIEVIHEELGRKMPRLTIPLKFGELAALPFDIIIKLTGKNLPISSARVRKLCTSTLFNGEKAHKRLPGGITLEQCLRSTVSWYKDYKAQ